MTATLVSTILRLLIAPWMGGASFVTYYPSLLIAGLLGGGPAGLVNLFLDAVVAGYLWLPPEQSFDFDQDSFMKLAVFLVAGIMMLGVVQLTNTLILALRASFERSDRIAAMLQERVSTILQLVETVARVDSAEMGKRGFQQGILGRIQALAEVQDLTTAAGETETSLRSLVLKVLAQIEPDRLVASGEPVVISQRTGAALTLVFHELLANAVRYGALSRPFGRVILQWWIEEDHVILHWHETGGPRARSPRRQGFGSQFLPIALKGEGGSVRTAFGPSGIEVAATFPGRPAQSRVRANLPRSERSDAGGRSD